MQLTKDFFNYQSILNNRSAFSILKREYNFKEILIYWPFQIAKHGILSSNAMLLNKSAHFLGWIINFPKRYH